MVQPVRAAALSGLVVAVFFAVFSLAGGASAQGPQGPLPVTVAKPLIEKIIDWDEYTGRFEAVNRVELRARTTGYLDKILFDEGQIVPIDEPLFLIDPRPARLQFDRAIAEVRAAKAERRRAQSQLARQEELVRRRTGAESTLDERRADKLRADANVAIAEAALRTAELELDYTRVRAPFAGRISDSRVDIGNLVRSGETVLATIVSTDPIHLVFTASEADCLRYSRLSRSGDRQSSRTAPNAVEARLLDEEGWPHKGEMDFVANELDPNAGTIIGRAVFKNEDGLLAPGLFARLRLVGSGEYEAKLIPDEAILSDQARKIVMVVGEKDVVEARVVTLGPLYRGLRVVRSGLNGDERIVVNGVQRARPGQPVAPQEGEISFETASVPAEQ